MAANVTTGASRTRQATRSDSGTIAPKSRRWRARYSHTLSCEMRKESWVKREKSELCELALTLTDRSLFPVFLGMIPIWRHRGACELASAGGRTKAGCVGISRGAAEAKEAGRHQRGLSGRKEARKGSTNGSTVALRRSKQQHWPRGKKRSRAVLRQDKSSECKQVNIVDGLLPINQRAFNF